MIIIFDLKLLMFPLGSSRKLNLPEKFKIKKDRSGTLF